MQFAKKWEKILREEFCELYSENLRIYSGQTNTDLIHPIWEEGVVQTTWGDEKELIKRVSTTKNYQETVQYFKAIKW